MLEQQWVFGWLDRSIAGEHLAKWWCCDKDVNWSVSVDWPSASAGFVQRRRCATAVDCLSRRREWDPRIRAARTAAPSRWRVATLLALCLLLPPPPPPRAAAAAPAAHPPRPSAHPQHTFNCVNPSSLSNRMSKSHYNQHKELSSFDAETEYSLRPITYHWNMKELCLWGVDQSLTSGIQAVVRCGIRWFFFHNNLYFTDPWFHSGIPTCYCWTSECRD